ncbi:MAG: hypothetical protein LBC71_08735 [Oscillospiraceae bacterium]|jgi:signal transduction histidine kinase|nr:hypothetical protein [Oscillospiraceae bacterium]
MTQQGKNELTAIRRDLVRQIEEVRRIANDLRDNHQGIGSADCAMKLHSVREKLERANRLLNNLDTKTLVPDLSSFKLPF